MQCNVQEFSYLNVGCGSASKIFVVAKRFQFILKVISLYHGVQHIWEYRNACNGFEVFPSLTV